MSNYQPAGVVGRDGAQPLWDPDDVWRQWSIDQIYIGLIGTKRYVPKLKDYVIKPETYETWIVKELNPITLIPTLDPIKPYGMSSSLEQSDVLFGVGPGTQAQLARVYLYTGVYPYRLTVDTHLFIGGTRNAYAKIFKGGDPSLGGTVVSRIYDNSGNFVSENVPLELVSMNNTTNHAVKIVSECACVEALLDGEVLTVVFYSADGVPQSKAQLLVENTNAIRGLNVDRKYVSEISLQSPWVSENEPSVLKFPLNIPVDALGLMGKVTYSDGSTMLLPVDQNKFSLMGIDGYLSSIPGERVPLVLKYNLDVNETSIAAQGVLVDKVATRQYSLVTQDIQPGYTVKLFMLPFWDAVNLGYKLRYWLFDLARTSFVDVTAWVQLSPEMGAYDPQAFNYLQRLQVNLNLRKVSQSYTPMIHTQIFEISLFGQPSDQDTPWLISNQPAPNTPAYGREASARRRGNTLLTVDAGRATQQEWLDEIYGLTYPLVDLRSEIRAPLPTHFEVSVDGGNNWTDYEIAFWDKEIAVNGLVTLNNTALIRFVKRSGSGNLYLSMGALTIKS